MTVSRIRALPLLLAFLAPAAWAQPVASAWDSDVPPVLTDKDMPPVTDKADKPAAPAVPSMIQGATAPPSQLEPDAATAPTTAAVPLPDKSVVVDSLGATEGPAAGILDTANGGLGEEIWGGTSRAAVEELLTRIPLASADPALRSLAKLLVLTKASAPVGPSKRAFVTLRIVKLLDAGLIDEAGSLAAQVSLAGDLDFARVQADALLISNRSADVCGDLTAARLTAGEPFWLQLREYCAAAAGDAATAELTRAVLEAQGNGDRTFDTLMDDVLNHQTVAPGPVAHPTAMHVFLLRLAGLPIPGGVAAAMGTSENLLALRDARNSIEVRIEAADRILRTGAMTSAELRTLADAHEIPAERLATALTDAPNLPFFIGQILLRRAAQLETRPDVKAQLVFAALSLGDKAGLLPLVAGLQSDLVTTIKPTASNQSMASLFARTLLLAGQPNAAEHWLGKTDVLRPAVDLAAPNPARDAELQATFTAYVAAYAANPPLPDPDRSIKALLVGIADVLGTPLPPDVKAQVPSIEAQLWGGKRPDADTMQRIVDASSKPERKGEALLLILETARSIGLSNLAPDVTIEFVRLLAAMGLPNAAREFGMEAIALYVQPPPPLPPAPAH